MLSPASAPGLPLPGTLPDDDDAPPEDEESEGAEEAPDDELPDGEEPSNDDEASEDEVPPDEAPDPGSLPHPFVHERSKPRTEAGSQCRIADPSFHVPMQRPHQCLKYAKRWSLTETAARAVCATLHNEVRLAHRGAAAGN